MKHNGFTLIEMMAVIVLVALLAVIGVATYTNVNESAKQKTLESKKEQIRSSAIKWAKENNISNKTVISVNALVVEGYLTADENEVGKIGVIENPVTGENMICNTVDISLKEGEYLAAVNDKEENCALATQSLVDTNINIKVVDAKNKNVTGSGSIAAWTNQNVMIIVSSSTYDSRATSISYDFEGNTITKQKSGKQKYTGSSYISEGSAGNYYNVFHVDANLMLNTKIVVTYNIAGESSKSRAYTIRIDKEEANASVSSNSEWLTVDKDVYVTVDDGKGSGPRYFYIGKDQDINNATRKTAGYKTKVAGLEVGKYYIWTEDIAGNKSSTFKVILELNNVDKTEPACEVLFHGHPGNNGWYKEVPVTPGGKNTVKAGISGMNIGVNTTKDDPEYTAFAAYNEFNEGLGTTRTTNTSKSGVDYYCHAKTLAGNYANAKRTLKLDMTPPTITIDTTTDTNYTQIKSIKFTVADGLSGLPERLPFRWGWSKSQDCANLSTTEFVMYGHQHPDPYTSYIYGPKMWFNQPLTGIYYLCIDFSQITDYAGNHATSVNGSGGGGRAIFGPFYFDNTPPVCDGNNGKTTWTNGSYTINQLCIDDDGTTDQSGCEQRTWTTKYLDNQSVKTDKVTIADKAGNTTKCHYDVYLDNKKPSCSLTQPGADGNNGWYKSSSVTISATFKDNGTVQSGVGSYGTAKTTGSTNGNSSVTFTENGKSLKAYCYVKDVAGNEYSKSLTFKKDDGSEMGNCKILYGNTSWKKKANITVGVELGSKPISGCNDGYNCKTKDEYPIHDNEAVTQGNTSGNSSVLFMSNSGVVYSCPNGPHNIYSDRQKPTCSVSKSNTETTSGVTFTVTCDDGAGSGCVSSGDSQGEHTDVKSSKTYTVKDNVGNKGTCAGSVTSYSCNPHNCNKHTCYGKWSDLGACNVPDNKAKNSDTKECTECGSQGLYQCKTRSSWDCYDTCYDTCYK